MQVLSGLRAGLLAIAALFGAVSVANAENGTIRISIFKAGFIVGGSAGNGVLTFHGRNYPLSIGGLSYGFTFGASETTSMAPSAIFAVRRMSPGSTPRAAPAPPSGGARRPLSSPTRAAPC